MSVIFRMPWAEGGFEEDSSFCLERTMDSDYRGIVLSDPNAQEHLLHSAYRSGVSSLRMMEEKIGFDPKGYSLPYQHFLVEEYNEIIRRLRDAGITEHWNKFFKRNEKLGELGPQVLDMDDLEVCFCVCAIPMVASIVCFMCELAGPNVEYCCRRLALKLRKMVSHSRKKLKKRKKKKLKVKEKKQEKLRKKKVSNRKIKRCRNKTEIV